MGLHKDTAIHRTARELFKVMTIEIRNMPRDVKQYMGHKIRDEVLEAIDHIYMANVARDKRDEIEALRRRVQRVEILLQESVDLQFITQPAYSRAIKLTESIGRQASGWLKYSASHAPVA